MTSDAVVVLASTPGACDVCRGREAVAWQWAGARQAHRAPCPHCAIGLPAVYLPFRVETVKESR